MTDRISYEYFQLEGNNKNLYYQIPKALMLEPEFRELDNDDIMAYSIMLDRTALSVRNRWVDRKGRVYIYLTVAEACTLLRLGKTKMEKVFHRLTELGLIERVRQGLGKPAIIYVKNIVVNDVDNSEDQSVLPQNGHENGLSTSDEDRMADTGLPQDVPTDDRTADHPDGRRTASNDQKENNMDIYQYHQESDLSDAADQDGIDDAYDRDFCMDLIRKRIEYDFLKDVYPEKIMPLLNDFVDLIVDVVMSDENEYVISKKRRSGDLVRRRFLQLRRPEMEYVMESMRFADPGIRNMRKYMMTVLFNAPGTAAGMY